MDWEKILRKYAEGVIEAESVTFGAADGLTPEEDEALDRILTEVKDAYWKERERKRLAKNPNR